MPFTIRDKLCLSDRARFAVAVSLFFAAFFLLVGVMLPFLPLWLSGRGLSPSEVATVVAAPMLLRVLATPGLTFLVDRSDNRRLWLVGLALVGTITFAALGTVSGFTLILLLFLTGASVWHPLMAAMEGVAQSGSTRYRLDYGRLRLWGSVSFIAANVLGGLVVAWIGADVTIVLLFGAALLTAVSLMLAGHYPVDIDTGGRVAAASKPFGLSDYLEWIRRPSVIAFVLGVGLIQSSHAVYYAFGTIHWESLGYATSTIGILWATGVVAEVALFAVSGRAIAAFGLRGLIFLAAAGAVVRWSITALDPVFSVLMLVQLGHALTFGATHLASVTLIARIAPASGGSSAQAFHFTLSGVVMGALTFASGPLYTSFGSYAYFAMALSGAVGGLIAIVAAGILIGQPQRDGGGGDTVAPS